MIHSSRTSPRAEYLQQANLRVQASPSLAKKFPHLKSATMNLGHFDAERLSCSSQIKYTVNVEHAKSIVRIACHNHECVRGDFDLTDTLAEAVQARDTNVSGEICCPGWRGRATIDVVPCGNVLRYQISLGY
jgi:hypothetical protein